jgi:hypothetical protein
VTTKALNDPGLNQVCNQEVILWLSQKNLYSVQIAGKPSPSPPKNRNSLHLKVIPMNPNVARFADPIAGPSVLEMEAVVEPTPLAKCFLLPALNVARKLKSRSNPVEISRSIAGTAITSPDNSCQ